MLENWCLWELTFIEHKLLLDVEHKTLISRSLCIGQPNCFLFFLVVNKLLYWLHGFSCNRLICNPFCDFSYQIRWLVDNGLKLNQIWIYRSSICFSSGEIHQIYTSLKFWAQFLNAVFGTYSEDLFPRTNAFWTTLYACTYIMIWKY